MCTCGLNCHLKCSFKSILEKKPENFSLWNPFFKMSYMKCLLKCPYSKKRVLPRKIPGCVFTTLILIFHPNFHPNIWVFANLPIDRKLIHGNIRLSFWKLRIFWLILFWKTCKIVCKYKYLHWKLWLFLFLKRYILFLFTSIGILIFVSVIC